MDPVREADPNKNYAQHISGLDVRDSPKSQPCTPDVEVIYFVLDASSQPLPTPLPAPTKYKKNPRAKPMACDERCTSKKSDLMLNATASDG